MIPDRVVDEVRARADIVEVVGEHVQLKRAGKDFKALCPFHKEKTPSFYVVPAKGFYKCFGCGETGDVFTFLMKQGGLGFLDAVRQLAARTGVEIPDSTAREAEDPHRPLYEALAFAADHFQRILREDAAGEAARRYLKKREVSDEAVERFLLGHAPDEWRRLRDAAHHHGITDDILLASGLIKESERAEEPFDRFRDRLVFPIADGGGRVIAFGGRTLARAAENVPKYLNSPETAVHQKGRVLYGLNWGKSAIRREGVALVVEGYFDFVSLAARGVENTVAGMGTALSPEQANLLARYTGKVFLLYDSDAAGLRAAFRSGDALLRAGVHPLIVTLPEGEDPDSLVRRRGADALRAHLENAGDVLERKIQLLEARGFFSDSDGRRRALDRLLSTLRSVTDPALRDIYIARVEERTKVRRETLEQELAEAPDSRPYDAPFGGFTRARPLRRRPRPEFGTPTRVRHLTDREAERLLLLLLVRDPAWIRDAADLVDAASLHDRGLRTLFEAMVAGGAEGLEDLDSNAADALAQLRDERMEITDVEHTFRDVVAELAQRQLRVRLASVQQRLASSTDEEQKTLLRDKEAIRKQLYELGARKSLRLLGYAATRAPAHPPSTDDS